MATHSRTEYASSRRTNPMERVHSMPRTNAEITSSARRRYRSGRTPQSFRYAPGCRLRKVPEQDDERDAAGAHQANDRAPKLDDPAKRRVLDPNTRPGYLGEGRSEDQDDHEKVENSFEQPGGDLGGERDLFLRGDQVRGGRVHPPVRKHYGREADTSCIENTPKGGMLGYRLDHHGPRGAPARRMYSGLRG